MKCLAVLLISLFSLETVSSQITEPAPAQELLTAWRDVRKLKTKCSTGEKVSCIPCEKNTYKHKIGYQYRCVDCREGFGTLTDGSTLKTDCIKYCREGQFFNIASMLCEDCPQDYYMDVRGLSTECKPCPLGKKTTSGRTKSADLCFLNCGLGEQPNPEETECVPCPEGTYKDTEGATPCKLCPELRPSTLEDGTDSKDKCIKVCEPGKEYNVTTNRCDPCERDFYKATMNSRDRCVPCEPNTVAKRKGLTECEVECGPGYQFSGQGCVACPWGTFKVKTGNDIPCTPCTSETGPDKVTLARGSSDRTQCLRFKDECFTKSLPDLEFYYDTVRNVQFNEDTNIIPALIDTCHTSLRETINKIVTDFIACPDLKQIILPDVTLGSRTYGHDVQMKLLLNIVEHVSAKGGDYCDYLGCVAVHEHELMKCKAMMKTEVTGPVPFCSDPWRVGASCVTLNLINCPPLQFHPTVTEQLDLRGLQAGDIADIGNMVTLCGGGANAETDSKVEPSTSPSTLTEDTGGGANAETDSKVEPSTSPSTLTEDTVPFEECEAMWSSHLQALTNVTALCLISDQLLESISCLESGGYLDQFFDKYLDLLAAYAPFALLWADRSFLTLRNQMVEICTSASFEKCQSQLLPLLEPALSSLTDPSQVCSVVDGIRSAVQCFVDEGIEAQLFASDELTSLMGMLGISLTSIDTAMSALDSFCAGGGGVTETNPKPESSTEKKATFEECESQLLPILEPVLSSVMDPFKVCSVTDNIRNAAQCFVNAGFEMQLFTTDYMMNLMGMLGMSFISVDTAMNALDMYCAAAGNFLFKK